MWFHKPNWSNASHVLIWGFRLGILEGMLRVGLLVTESAVTQSFTKALLWKHQLLQPMPAGKRAKLSHAAVHVTSACRHWPCVQECGAAPLPASACCALGGAGALGSPGALSHAGKQQPTWALQAGDTFLT